MEREEERNLEELEERGEQVEQDIEEAKDQAAETEGIETPEE